MINLFKRLLSNRTRQRPQPTQDVLAASREARRRELVAVAVRDTLREHGIPASWITAEIVPVPAAAGDTQRAIHLRLNASQWQPDLLACSIALQKIVKARILRLDPFSAKWLAGVSMNVDPDPGHWIAPGSGCAAGTAPGAAGQQPTASARAAMEGLCREDLAPAGWNGREGDGFSATVPMSVDDLRIARS